MSQHLTISPSEAADRLAIRELVEAYAHCADRRDAKGQMALFTADTHFVVYMNAKDPKPSQELHSREALAPVFADLNKYAATMHFVGQSTILTLNNDRGTGETYCMPHHLTVDGNERRLEHARLPGKVLFVEWHLEVVPDESLVGVNPRHRKQREHCRRKEDEPAAHPTPPDLVT